MSNKDNWLESMKKASERGQKQFSASFCKLRDGSWGARIKREDIENGDLPQRCDELNIIKKNGESKAAMVGSLIAEFDDAVLVSLY